MPETAERTTSLPEEEEDDEDEELYQHLTWKHAVAMLFCSASSLMGLYFLIKAGFEALVTVMQVMFGYAALVSTYKLVFYPCLRRHCPRLLEAVDAVCRFARLRSCA